MVKRAKPKQEEVAENPSQFISLSAELAVDRFFLDMRNPKFNELVAFASDVSLRIAAIIKDGCKGETETEKMLNALNVINAVSTQTVAPPAEPAKE